MSRTWYLLNKNRNLTDLFLRFLSLLLIVLVIFIIIIVFVVNMNMSRYGKISVPCQSPKIEHVDDVIFFAPMNDGIWGFPVVSLWKTSCVFVSPGSASPLG